MGATLDALHRLQEVELQLADVQRGIDVKVRAVRKQEARLAEIDATIAAAHASIRAQQVEADKLDLEVKSREADIARLRQALNVSKTNKEYSAVLTQLNTNKADNSKFEERALTLLTEIDVKKKEYAATQEQRAAEAARLEELRGVVRATEKASQARLDALGAERKQSTAGIPPRVLDLFTRVAGKNEGRAMSRVIRTNPKRAEYACDGCNMAITIEQVNAIMSRDEAVMCNICGHILYLESTPAASARN